MKSSKASRSGAAPKGNTSAMDLSNYESAKHAIRKWVYTAPI